MGCGTYIALMYGIVNIDDKHLKKKKKEKFYDELLSLSENIKNEGSYGINTSYESGDNYVAVFVAVSKTFLSNWWGVGFMEDCPIVDMEEKVNNLFPKEYKKAKRFWSKKVQPIMNKYKIKTLDNDLCDFVLSKPKLNIIKDYD